jgi:hypothetical protein
MIQRNQARTGVRKGLEKLDIIGSGHYAGATCLGDTCSPVPLMASSRHGSCVAELDVNC